MSSKENNEVAVEKIDNEKGLEGKCELKGTKRAAEVIIHIFNNFVISFLKMCFPACNFVRVNIGSFSKCLNFWDGKGTCQLIVICKTFYSM